MFDAADPYVSFLLRARDRLFYLQPWSGNSGDGLVWKGTVELLSHLGIRTTVDPAAADVILLPGGNQTMWLENIGVWREVWARFPRTDFVVGPATFQFGSTPWAEMVKRSRARIVALFARDPASFRNLQRAELPSTIETGLSHDAALFLRDTPWLKAHKEAATDEFALVSFRFDKESTGVWTRRMQALEWAIPARLHDAVEWPMRRLDRRRLISRAARRASAGTPLKVCDVSLCAFEYFVEIIRRAKEIHTDRLHTLLLAAMLGKPAYAYPTSFGKLEAVYEHSLQGWAEVTFVSSNSNSPGQARG